MTNVQTKLEGSILTLTVDLSADHGLSKSGKSRIIASTEGNAKIEANGAGTVYLGLNVYRK